MRKILTGCIYRVSQKTKSIEINALLEFETLGPFYGPKNSLKKTLQMENLLGF
jgi:hypothetical protein